MLTFRQKCTESCALTVYFVLFHYSAHVQRLESAVPLYLAHAKEAMQTGNKVRNREKLIALDKTLKLVDFHLKGMMFECFEATKFGFIITT